MRIRERFNPRAPCGARLIDGNDLMVDGRFQPTRPLRGATNADLLSIYSLGIISTHAPLAGRDELALLAGIKIKDFNPRAPCGARRGVSSTQHSHKRISTHAPLAGRDCRRRQRKVRGKIFQPTRPLRGATPRWMILPCRASNFNPRAPCGARLEIIGGDAHGRRISTHAPLAGRDALAKTFYDLSGEISTHAPLAGRDNQSND